MMLICDDIIEFNLNETWFFGIFKYTSTIAYAFIRIESNDEIQCL